MLTIEISFMPSSSLIPSLLPIAMFEKYKSYPKNKLGEKSPAILY